MDNGSMDSRSHGHEGYAASYSNLSALAMPFTVVPISVAIPLGHWTEFSYGVPLSSSLHNWLPSDYPDSGLGLYSNHPTEYDPMHSSDAYGYGGSHDIHSSYSHSTPVNPIASVPVDGVATSTVEAQVYCPSYIPLPIEDHDLMVVPDETNYDFSSISDVVTSDGSSKNDHTQSGCHFEGAQASKGSYTCEEGSNVNDMLGREKHGGCSNTEWPNNKSFPVNNLQAVPIDYSKTFTYGSPLVLPDNPHKKPFFEEMYKRQVPCIASYEKHIRHCNARMSGSASCMTSSPSLVIRPPDVDTSMSAPNTGPLEDMNFGTDATDPNVCCNGPSYANESFPLLDSKNKVRFDTSLLRMHLGTNDSRMESLSLKNEELSKKKEISEDALDQAFKTKSGFQISRTSSNGCNLTLDPIENSSESLDYYNPVVDSPCWKGAPVIGSNLTPSLTRQQNSESSKMIPEKYSSETCVEDPGSSISDATSSQDVSVYSSGYDLSSSSSVEDSSDNLTELDEPDSTSKIDVQTLINLMRDMSGLLLFRTSNDSLELKDGDCEVLKDAIFNLHRCMLKDGEQMTVTRESIFPQQGTSQYLEDLPKLPMEVNVDSPRVTKEAAVITRDQLDHKCHHEEKHHNIGSGNTMEMISDFVSAKGGANMVEKDNMTQAIMKVLSENFDHEEEMQPNGLYKKLWLEAEAELCSIKYKARYNHLRIEMEKSELHEAKDVAVNTPDVEKRLSKAYRDLNAVDKVIPNAKVEAKFGPYSGISIQDTPFMQPVMARYGILKNRIDHSNSTTTLEEASSSRTYPEVNKVDQLIPETAQAKYAAKYKPPIWVHKVSTNVEELLSSSVSPLLNEVKKDTLIPDISIPNSPISTRSPNTDEVEDDKLIHNAKVLPYSGISIQDSPSMQPVMARYGILKNRIDHSNSATTLEEASSSRTYPEVNKVDQLIPETAQAKYAAKYIPPIWVHKESTNVEEPPTSSVSPLLNEVKKDTLIPDISIPNSPISIRSPNTDEVEDSIMTRFHILKCRDDNSRSMDVKRQEPTEAVRLGFSDEKNHRSISSERSEDGSVDLKLEPVLQHSTANSPEDKLTVKEFQFHEDDPTVQSRHSNRLGDALAAGWSDSSSSDWEHVTEEELMG